MARENKIQIVSQYTDLSSEKMKASFKKVDVAVDKTAIEMKKMRESIRRSMTASRKDVKDAMEGMVAATNKQKVAIRQAGEQAGRFRGSLGVLGKEIGKIRNYFLLFFFVLRPIQRAFTELMESMTRQEDAVKRLNIALQAQATYTPRVSEQLQDLSKSFQRVTRYGDEAVQEVMQQLITIGGVMPYQLKRVTQAVLDFSSATGRDLATSALIMAKAASGFTGELSRYGIIIEKNIPKTEKFNTVLEFIEKRMGGVAQKDVETIAGRYKQLGNAFGDVKENIGFVITEALKLKVVFEELNKFATTGWLGQFAGKINVTGIDQLRNRLQEVTDQMNRMVKAGGLDRGIGKETLKNLENERIILVRLLQTEIERQKLQDRGLRLQDKITQKEQTRAKLLDEFYKEYEDWEMKQPQRELISLNKRFDNYRKLTVDKIKLEEIYADEKNRIELKILAEEKRDKRLENAKESAESLKAYFAEQGEAYKDLTGSFAVGMRDALKQGFIDVVKGDFEGLKDIVVSFGDMMLEAIMKQAANAIMIMAGFSRFTVGVHSGGYMLGKESSHGVTPQKKYHRGGEVNATLLEGEGVLNRRAMGNVGVDNLNRLNRGEGMGGGQTINNYYIQTIDERSFRDRLSQHPDIYSNASEMNIRDNRSLRGTSQRWG